MNSEEYQEIIQLLREQKYPETVQDTANKMELQKETILQFLIRTTHFSNCDLFLKPRK